MRTFRQRFAASSRADRVEFVLLWLTIILGALLVLWATTQSLWSFVALAGAALLALGLFKGLR